MSGAITATTIAAISSAVVGAAGVGYSVYAGQKQQGTQQVALKNQTTAQDKATAGALSTERQNATAMGAANQKTPDVSSILQRAATSGKGLSSTMLTGPSGVDTTSLNLGKTTLLGT